MPVAERLERLNRRLVSPAVTSSVLRPRALEPKDIIFGCGPLVYSREGLIPQEEVDAAIAAALDAGVVAFDTAPLYGDSEDRLGHGLHAYAKAHGPPAGVQVITKAGKLVRRLKKNKDVALTAPAEPFGPFALTVDERCLVPDYSFAGAARSLEESVARMTHDSAGGS